ncbi:Vacuolar protein sorting-associated protein 8-like protein [Larimichthys crocea]|uniref:Uncharacterized protein n=1 Tax=Larimichthys crocea TaxID=215358 RepID=A0ACD3QAB5_LARCR|nr:Vacuolar protein sorting-associated protein 8-like protein [Larimichthys crocea]
MSESPDARSLLSASSQLNLMEVDAIDDKEFDIPQVDTPPTLESILNEKKAMYKSKHWKPWIGKSIAAGAVVNLNGAVAMRHRDEVWSGDRGRSWL